MGDSRGSQTPREWGGVWGVANLEIWGAYYEPGTVKVAVKVVVDGEVVEL